MMFIFFALVFSIIVAVFAIQNSIAVTVSFLVWSFQTSLVIIILGSASVGALVIWCLATWAQFRMRREINKATQRQTELESDNKALQLKLEKLEKSQAEKTADNSSVAATDKVEE